MLECLSVNQVLFSTDEQLNYRILYISPDGLEVYWIVLDKESGLPVKVTLQFLEEKFLLGKLESVEDKWIMMPTDKEDELARRDKLWGMLGETLQNEPYIYRRNSRGKLLNNVAEQYKVPVQHLYNPVRKYWQYGKDKNAFLPDNRKKGGKGKERLYQNKPGRKSSDLESRGKVLTEQDFQLFEKYIRKEYLKKDHPTLKQVYRDMVRSEYADIVRDEFGMEYVTAYEGSKVPSYRQFYYWYSKHRDHKEETEKRESEKEYDLNDRPTVGKADSGLYGPGSEYQIDATIADIYLVSRFNRKNIIGRPVVYFVKDVFSRIVAGLYIGLEGPSWMGMSMALYNSFIDKVAFCHSYGLEISEEQWPCHHVPFSLLGDRGELESENANRLVEELGIRVSNTPPYRGDLKPIIERHFRILNDTCVTRLPGNVKPDMSQRGGHDYRFDAILDLYQFTRIIIHNTLLYNTLTLNNIEPSEAMMRAGVDLNPLALWTWGKTAISGALKTISEEKARYVLLPRSNCEITRSGVKFKKLVYTGREPIEQRWFDTAGRNGNYSKVVSYDPRDSSAIYVWHDEGKKPVRLELADWEIRFRGQSIDECLYQQEIIDLKKKQKEKQDEDTRMTADQFVDSVVAEARALMPDVSGMSKAERVGSIGENRKTEKEENRKKESMVQGPGISGSNNSDPSQNFKEQTGPEEPVRGKRELSDLEKMLWEIDDDE